MNKLRKENGSATVEMSFVFPVILFVIVIMMFFGMFMYEKVAAQSIMDDVLSRAAANWATAEDGIYTEKSTTDDFSVWKVYSRIIDMNDGDKKANVKSEALRRLKIVCLFSDNFEDDDVTLDSTNVIIYKSLELTVDRTYTLPFAGFLRGLGVSPELHYKLTSTAVVQDAPELIRTIDIAADLLEKTALGDAYKKFQDAMSKVSDFFKDFRFGE